MHYTVVAKRSIFFAVSMLCMSAMMALVGIVSTSYASGTTVGATVCQSTSQISLAQPVSDSTVTQPTVPLAGAVAQANQIEIYIDDVFDSVIPLTIGQTNFTGSVELSQGTHTIKVVAINICPGPNGSASSVVTYSSPPDTTPSNGQTTQTTVSEPSKEAVSTQGGEIKNTGTGGQLFPEQLSIPFQRFLGWLNINTADTTEAHSLSLWRAVVIGSGLYLLIVGVATTAVQLVASVPFVTAILPAPTASGRVKRLSWVFRGLGLLLVLGGLFL